MGNMIQSKRKGEIVMQSFQQVGRVMDKVIASVDAGMKIETAARLLREEADAEHQHIKLSNMLRICAEGLRDHPAPGVLCRANEARLNATVSVGDPANWGDITGVQITLAAEAFGRAAEALGVE